MTPTEFAANILVDLPYTANDQQTAVVAALAQFVMKPAGSADCVFILNGYAGTGKTSLMGSLVHNLRRARIRSVLMAPTGRAAKVFSTNASGRHAYTIHRRIYSHSASGTGGFASQLRENNDTDTVFIVDEASMIGNDADEKGMNLLEDLIHYVYSGVNCRLILLGDTAQLPPVGGLSSPAMNPDTFRRLGIKVTRATLTETARQAADSGILYNATALRRALARGGESVPSLRTSGFSDIQIISGEDLPDILQSVLSTEPDDTILITRSNRRATEFNLAIRSQILYYEEELVKGDSIIVGKNHYFNGKKPKGIDFLANGDILTIEKVYGTESRYGGLRFADVSVSISSSGTGKAEESKEIDEEGDETAAPEPFDTKIMLATLTSPEAGMSRKDYEALYYGAMTDPDYNAADAGPDTRLRNLRTNPYWNALQVKFAYSITCHKAQGGQWSNVFVDLSYIPEDAPLSELYRWLYTAVTRARKRLWLINPPEILLK